MDYRWLQTFRQAAHTLNFRKTAEQLLMSQPNVTVHIRQLEESIGVRLFDRTNNRVTLTDAGKQFLPEAERMLNDMDDSVQRLRAFSQGYRRSWNIAISPLMAETVLPYILRGFMARYPDTEINIHVEESEAIEQRVEAGDIHLGISALPAKLKEIHSEPLYEDPVLFVMPTDMYDTESGPPIDLRQVLQENALFTHHHPVYWDQLLHSLKHEVPAIRPVKVTQAHIAKQFVQQGIGTTFLPRSMARRELIEGRIMQPHFDLMPLPTVGTYAIYRKLGKLEEDFILEISRHFFK